jgi:hypothetical protein
MYNVSFSGSSTTPASFQANGTISGAYYAPSSKSPGYTTTQRYYSYSRIAFIIQYYNENDLYLGETSLKSWSYSQAATSSTSYASVTP